MSRLAYLVSTPSRRRLLVAAAGVLALQLTMLVAPLSGQLGSRPPSGGDAFIVGPRGGYDFQNDAPLLGAFLRSATFGRVFVQGTADLTFLNGLTDRQAGADVLVRLGRGGVLLGGGPVWRSSVFPGDDGFIPLGAERETRVGYSFVGILGGLPGRGRYITSIEFRYTVVDEIKPQVLSLQIGIPLLRW